VTNTVKIGLDCEDVAAALYRHHPAYSGPTGKPWVVLREWMGIDLLALECWRQARVIGYEIKVSRSDMRAELLDPTKRMEAVSRCTQFYIAVPAGLLTADEIEFVEPDWSLADFEPPICTNPECRARHYLNGRGWMKRRAKPRGPRLRGTDLEGVTVHLGSGRESGRGPDGSSYSIRYERTACCAVCRGYGRVGRSRVEEEAPTLWVPKDVGLVEVSGQGVVEVRRAPVRKMPKTVIGGAADQDEHRNRLVRHGIAQIVRHASAYQDPRHRGHRAV
jgi:hypothetical protein